MTLHLLHYRQCLDENQKHIYFGSHICSLIVAFLSMVVLAVIYLDHLKHCYVMSHTYVNKLTKVIT